MCTELVLKEFSLNTKNSNAELSADLRTVSHANLMIYFSAFSGLVINSLSIITEIGYILKF